MPLLCECRIGERVRENEGGWGGYVDVSAEVLRSDVTMYEEQRMMPMAMTNEGKFRKRVRETEGMGGVGM